jgi:hypothetical protein
MTHAYSQDVGMPGRSEMAMGHSFKETIALFLPDKPQSKWVIARASASADRPRLQRKLGWKLRVV